MDKVPEQKKSEYGLAIGVALLVWGIVFVVFPHVTNMPGFGAWVCYILALVCLLAGTLGTCVEVFRR